MYHVHGTHVRTMIHASYLRTRTLTTGVAVPGTEYCNTNGYTRVLRTRVRTHLPWYHGTYRYHGTWYVTSQLTAAAWGSVLYHHDNGTRVRTYVALQLQRPRRPTPHSAYVERVAEANLEDDHHAASFATDPCHGLLCRCRWKRVTKRHDSIRDRLATVLGRVSGTSATVEPRVLQPQDGADQRRGDIKVRKHGNTWILDVGVVCPGTQRYVDQGNGTTPGLAAEASGEVRRPRQLHPVYPGDRWKCQQSGP